VVNRVSAIEDGTPERMYEALKKALQEAAYDKLQDKRSNPQERQHQYGGAPI